MLGGFAVGKTSLVRRFVSHLFSEEEHATIGVRIEQKRSRWMGRT
jgi:GTPase SAR1 family protein